MSWQAYCEASPATLEGQMLIEEWMRQPVHSVKPLDSISHARRLMVKHRVNQLPVVLDDRLVGIVTDRDLRDAFPSVFQSLEQEFELERGGGARRHRFASKATPDPETIAVEDVMTRDVLSLTPSDTVEEAASQMRRQRVGSIPITRGGRLLGILTRSDILDAFIALARTGAETIGA